MKTEERNQNMLNSMQTESAVQIKPLARGAEGQMSEFG